MLRLSKYGWLTCGIAPYSNIGSKKFSGCVEHFDKNYAFSDDNKFVIRYPIRIDSLNISDNKKRPIATLYRVDSKLNPRLKELYSKFLTKFPNLYHMTLVKSQSSAIYLPHRAVLRDQSSTTPLRVVFNASAKDVRDEKLSLNEAMLIRPILQRNIFQILISIRVGKFLYIINIEKMYRMIWIKEKDRALQHIVWRKVLVIQEAPEASKLIK